MDKYLNLYRLSPLPSGRESTDAIDTHWEKGSLWLQPQVKVSQCLWKHKN